MPIISDLWDWDTIIFSYEAELLKHSIRPINCYQIYGTPIINSYESGLIGRSIINSYHPRLFAGSIVYPYESKLTAYPTYMYSACNYVQIELLSTAILTFVFHFQTFECSGSCLMSSLPVYAWNENITAKLRGRWFVPVVLCRTSDIDRWHSGIKWWVS